MADWRAVSLLCVLGLAACAAEGQRFEHAARQSGMGTIYVYRPLGSFVGRGENPYVSIAGDGLQRLKPGGFIARKVPAGEYDVEVRQNVLFLPTWPESVSVAVAEGGSAYVKVDQKITEFGTDEGLSARQAVFIQEVNDIDAQAEIARLRENE